MESVTSLITGGSHTPLILMRAFSFRTASITVFSTFSLQLGYLCSYYIVVRGYGLLVFSLSLSAP